MLRSTTQLLFPRFPCDRNNITKIRTQNSFELYAKLENCFLEAIQYSSTILRSFQSHSRKEQDQNSKSLFFSLEAFFLIMRYTLQSTDLKTKCCFLQSLFFDLPPKKLQYLEEASESTAIAFLTVSFLDPNIPQHLREKFASYVVTAGLDMLNTPSHIAHRFLSETTILQFTCDLLYKCNLPQDSLQLKTLLQLLDEMPGVDASEYYPRISQDQFEEEELNDAFYTFYLMEQELSAIQTLSFEEREERAEGVGEACLELIQKASPEEFERILRGICGPEGVLHRYTLPDSSPTLFLLLNDLDTLTNEKASKIYFCGK